MTTEHKIEVAFFGCGGCGTNLVHATAEYLNQHKSTQYLFSWYLLDLSRDSVEIAKAVAKKSNGRRPTLFYFRDTGAGKIPFVAEIFFENLMGIPTRGAASQAGSLSGQSKQSNTSGTDDGFFSAVREEPAMQDGPTDQRMGVDFFSEMESTADQPARDPVAPVSGQEPAAEQGGVALNNRLYTRGNRLSDIHKGSVNVYMSSLGGGTGARTISLLIPRLQERTSGFIDVGVCVLTEVENEALNHVYNFPMVNEVTDFVILLQNQVILNGQAMEEDDVNQQAAKIVDMLISTRLPGTKPAPMDFLDFLSYLRKSRDYVVNKAHWMVPFIYPYDREYEKPGDETSSKTTLVKILEALEHGGLCEVNPDDIKKCQAAICIIRAPEAQIKEFTTSVHVNSRGEAVRQEAKFLEELSERLDLDIDKISYSYVPDEQGFKLCLLLLNVPPVKLRNLKCATENNPDKVEETLLSWHSAITSACDRFKRLIHVPDDNLEGFTTRVIKQASADNVTRDFFSRYNGLLG